MASHNHMAPTVISVRPLTAEAFAPFGDVIAADTAKRSYAINQGTCTRFHDLALVDCSSEGGRAGISLFRAQPCQLPVSVTVMERHPLGSQAFMPLSNRPYLVVVTEDPAVEPQAFLARPDQGVNYRRGTWHHALLALEAEADFLVIDRLGPGQNCEEQHLSRPWQIRTLELEAG